MKMLELFAGTHTMADTFREHGWETYTVDWSPDCDVDLHADIGALTPQDIIDLCGGVPDVIWASPDCFPAGTPVYTTDGFRNIEDIRCGEKVLTHTGRYKRVYDMVEHSEDALYEIKIAGVEPFRCTPNHKFYARKKVGYSTRKGGKSHRVSYMEEPQWVEAKDLSKEYRVGIPIDQTEKVPTGPIGYEDITRNSSFWWFVGLYFADGSISKTTVTICTQLGTDEGKELSATLDAIGLPYKERDCRTAHHHELHNKALCDFLLQFGKGATEKTATSVITSLPKESLKAFVSGYLHGDGYFDTSTKNPQYKFTTASRSLAYSMQLCIAKAFGRYCSITKKPMEKINHIIEGREVHVNDQYMCGFYVNDSNRFQYTFEDGMVWVNVKGISPIEEKAPTYCLSVKDDESFTAFGIAVHNCTTYSIAAISHHRMKTRDSLEPKTDYAMKCDLVNQNVLYLIDALLAKGASYYFMENPRGGMRKMKWMQDRPRYTLTYCQYGDRRMKPTDIWTNHPYPDFKPPCHNGDPCHEHAPRGSRTGTQGIDGKLERARIPKALCEHIVAVCEDPKAPKMRIQTTLE